MWPACPLRILLLPAVLLGITGREAPESPAAPEPTAFDHLESELFSVRCGVSGCHNGINSVMGLDLRLGMAWYSLVGRRSREMDSYGIEMFLVSPGSPDESYMLRKLAGHASIVGEQMPLQGPCLTPEELEAIRQWIAEGAMPPALSERPKARPVRRILVGTGKKVPAPVSKENAPKP